MTLDLYERFRVVPGNAQKEITTGRLKGKTDINPMWRIKALTEAFGPCGIGWRYEITDKRLEAGANGEIAAFVDINLYYKLDGAWSEAIPGTGGAAFVAKEKAGLYTSDECYKMALTDAISVACKALGIGADVYWSADGSKHTANAGQSVPVEHKTLIEENQSMIEEIIAIVGDSRRANAASTKRYGRTLDRLTAEELNAVLDRLQAKGA